MRNDMSHMVAARLYVQANQCRKKVVSFCVVSVVNILTVRYISFEENI